VSARKAAKIMGVNVKTMFAYCRAATEGLPSKLTKVERHPLTGHFLVDLDELRELRKQARA
jgi:hypothetical protein